MLEDFSGVFFFQIKAIEKADSTHTDSKLITINLRDLNDEPPIFVNSEDTVQIYEDIGANELIFNATATDRDAGDIITWVFIYSPTF